MKKIERAESCQVENKIQWKQNITNDTHPDTKAYRQALHYRELDALKTRTQIKYREEGEKSLHYFYSLEQRNLTQQAIQVLTTTWKLLPKLEQFQNTPSLRSLSAQIFRSAVRSSIVSDCVCGKHYSDPRSSIGWLSEISVRLNCVWSCVYSIQPRFTISD